MRHRRTLGRAVAMLALAMAVPLAVSVPAGAADYVPTQADHYAWLFRAADLSALVGLDAEPAITGRGDLDERIRALAEARGYLLRPKADGDLVSVGRHRLQPAAADGWRELERAAKEAGVPLVLNSAYRSVETQRATFVRVLGGRTTDEAIDRVLRYSAPPGYSKHQTGYAIDVRTPGGTIWGFGETAAYRWLAADDFANAKRFGFVPSYPPDGVPQGPEPEPWEFLWVGGQRIACGPTGCSPPAFTDPAAPGVFRR